MVAADRPARRSPAKRRFGEFEKSLGVAKNILTVRLRKLVALGVLEQVPVRGEHAPRVRADREGARAVPGADGDPAVGRGVRRAGRSRAGGPAGPEAGQAAGVPRPRRAGTRAGRHLVPAAELTRSARAPRK